MACCALLRHQTKAADASGGMLISPSSAGNAQAALDDDKGVRPTYRQWPLAAEAPAKKLPEKSYALKPGVVYNYTVSTNLSYQKSSREEASDCPRPLRGVCFIFWVLIGAIPWYPSSEKN